MPHLDATLHISRPALQPHGLLWTFMQIAVSATQITILKSDRNMPHFRTFPQILDRSILHFSQTCCARPRPSPVSGSASEFDYRKRVSFSLDRHSHDTLVRRPGSVRATGFRHGSTITGHFADSQIPHFAFRVAARYRFFTTVNRLPTRGSKKRGEREVGRVATPRTGEDTGGAVRRNDTENREQSTRRGVKGSPERGNHSSEQEGGFGGRNLTA